MDVRTIRIIKASSADREGLLAARIEELRASGFQVLFDDISPDPSWSWTAGSIRERSQAFNQALLEPESDAIMWARGGYGASDLLEPVPWDAVAHAKSKPIIGFSDVSAAHSALYTKTRRMSVHGPMPATVTWKKHGTHDVDMLVKILRGDLKQGEIQLTAETEYSGEIDGVLFGGCLSVLTSLIGSPFLPKSMAGHILFFEDIGENPGRILRMLTQWHHAGLFKGVRGLILGTFTDLGGGLPDSAPVLKAEVARRFRLPTFSSPDFGHISPNVPLVVGSMAAIKDNKLTWTLSSSNT